jgi:hypothetical protein
MMPRYIAYIPELGLILYPNDIDNVWIVPMNETTEAAANMGTFLADNQPNTAEELVMLGGVELTDEILDRLLEA